MKPLACWIGRHEWTTRVEGGETYKVCTGCGKETAPGPGGATQPGGDPATFAVSRTDDPSGGGDT